MEDWLQAGGGMKRQRGRLAGRAAAPEHALLGPVPRTGFGSKKRDRIEVNMRGGGSGDAGCCGGDRSDGSRFFLAVDDVHLLSNGQLKQSDGPCVVRE